MVCVIIIICKCVARSCISEFFLHRVKGESPSKFV